MSLKDYIDKIKDEISYYKSHPDIPIPYEKILKWMDEDDEDIRAEVLIPDLLYRAQPELSEQEIFSVYKYFHRKKIFKFQDYIDANEIAHSVGPAWDEGSGYIVSREEFVSFIGEMYKEADEDVRSVLFCGLLEHLFEYKSAREAFCRWKDDPMFSKVYKEACREADNFLRLKAENKQKK